MKLAPPDLGFNLVTFGFDADPLESLAVCARLGVRHVTIWLRHVERCGAATLRRRLDDLGLVANEMSNATLYAGVDRALRQKQRDDNCRAIDMAAGVGVRDLVVLGGPMPPGSRDLSGAHASIAEEYAWLYSRAGGIRLALEPLHPAYAGSVSCLNSLAQALDICDATGPQAGVAIDSFHCWWDPALPALLQRAGRAQQILTCHLADHLADAENPLKASGMIGDGIVDLPAFVNRIHAGGFEGPKAIEIFSRDDWWTRPREETLAVAIARFEDLELSKAQSKG